VQTGEKSSSAAISTTSPKQSADWRCPNCTTLQRTYNRAHETQELPSVAAARGPSPAGRPRKLLEVGHPHDDQWRQSQLAGTASKPLCDHDALLVAFAETRLDFALWRQACRPLGWDLRVAQLHAMAPSTLWPDTCQRIHSYAQVIRYMNRVVDAYADDLRERYDINERALVVHGSTDACLRRAANHELMGAALLKLLPFALILSSARRTRPSKDAHGHTHARGPPPNLTHTQEPSTSHVNVRDCFAMPTAC
jgi:hypothetical protein